VCPVGATFDAPDGAVLIDPNNMHWMRLLHPGLPLRLPVR